MLPGGIVTYLNKIKLSDIPEGGMVGSSTGAVPLLVAMIGGVLTALESTCTHRGCNVANGRVVERIVICPCHGSKFDLITGEVKGGPAVRPLKKHNVKIVKDEIIID
jgi:nitrite reductase/ring-hydroxylating ferredoxin subunit